MYTKKDIKFIGKVESQTNNWKQIQFLLILHDFFLSKNNNFANLCAKLLRKKNFEPNSWFIYVSWLITLLK